MSATGAATSVRKGADGALTYTVRYFDSDGKHVRERLGTDR
jgi:hypothetical protein